MKLDAFDRVNIPVLNEWRIKRSMHSIAKEDFPKIGVMVFDGQEGVAAGFLRNAEGIGIIDSLVSNPDVRSEKRNDALDLIFARLIDIAKEVGIHMILGASVDGNTIVRSKKFGFKHSDHMLMVLGGL